MLVGDDEPHAVQAALFEAAEEARPEHLILAIADVEVNVYTTAGALDVLTSLAPGLSP